MRLVRYGVAMSVDGYIAGPKGEYDWIAVDPEIDFGILMADFDTFLIGRKTFETMLRERQDKPPKGMQYVVFSQTLKQADYPKVRVERDAVRVVTELRSEPGKDIWLFGGGELFRSLLKVGLVDRVEVSVIPVLLGGGIQLLAAPAERAKLRLRKQHLYEKTGTMRLEYDLVRGAGRESRIEDVRSARRKVNNTKTQSRK
jgi:dihydrofolate reductase